jgi:hypothetical protein
MLQVTGKQYRYHSWINRSLFDHVVELLNYHINIVVASLTIGTMFYAVIDGDA